MACRTPAFLSSVCTVAACAAVSSLAAWGAEASGSHEALPDFFVRSVQPFLEDHCFDCHSGADAKGGVELDAYESASSVTGDRSTWQRVLRMVRGREMPPEDMPQPEPDEVEAITRWIHDTLNAVDCSKPVNPGRVTIRRLNRVEYGNTIRDLVGVGFDAVEKLPADDVGYGFDTIGDVLSLPPILMEKYLDAAEEIAARAIVVDELDGVPVRRGPEDLPESHRRIFAATKGAGEPDRRAARTIAERLVSRAYRRPSRKKEVDRLMGLFDLARDQGEGFEGGVRLVLTGILVSPNFLFKIELDPPADDPTGVRRLDEYELATRMAYFLWSSMPDDELLGEARAGTIRENLDSQARRMLADPKATALVESFAFQWLQLRNLETITPDKKLFSGFDDELRRAMLTESAMFFEAVVREDRSVLELIDADFTFVNEPLARHYGVEGVQGDEFRRVSLEGSPRGGLLTQASVLTVTSNPTRTSPVKRGRWIMETILGTPLPEPPANVPMLDESDDAVLSGTLRERMELHRKKEACAVCHRKMDALGFAMENFDAVGAWRTQDGEFPIDASAVLPDGQSFNGPAELKAILRESGRDDFVRCLTEKMLIYALGRGLEYYDKCAVDRITSELARNEYQFSTLVLEIIRSDPFQKRSGARE